MNILKRILSWAYGAGAFVHHLMYEEHLRPVRRVTIPTICVGNLAVGGTGKTPHVEFLVRLLSQAGFSVAVLSRGYRRSTKGYVLANDLSTAEQIGDEPRQMQLSCPEAIVAVCEDRYRGIKRLMKQYPDLDVIILDDAFQHRSLRCGFSVLLTQADRLYVEDHMLPYGRLRESSYGAQRADAIVVTNCPAGILPIEKRVISNKLQIAPYQTLSFSMIQYASLKPVFGSAVQVQPSGRCLLLAGIAQPHYFIEHVQQMEGVQLVDQMLFADHHAFQPEDIDALAEKIASSGAEWIITTEKDAARLRDSHMLSESLQAMCFYLPIQVFFDEDNLTQNVLRYVSENRRKLTK